VYAYGRHSTHKQELTREVQEQRCRDYFDRVLAPDGHQWVDFFYDPAVSAGRVPFAERPAGRLMFHAAQPGDHVIMTRLDRCFRSVLDGVSVMEQLEKRGVFFHSLDYNIDTSTPVGRYVRNILLAGAELERDLARERTNETYAYLMKAGLPYSKWPPMGWKIVVRDRLKQFRVSPKERAFIELLSKGRAAGASLNDLAIHCWTDEQALAQPRNYGSVTNVRWALQARDLGFPKVCSWRRISHMHREWRANGGKNV
jgi:DNA invertase Pin-like site-specific DNA recombinase